MKRAAIIIKNPQQQYEGLRTSVGLLLAGMVVQMFVLHHEIENMDEAYRDNMAFLDEIGGTRFSNNSENAEKYGFTHVTITQAAAKAHQADIVIPF
jgi:sterol desaturase/sphingolipid hydroxylase (fatty acid hydroxylase superfamily)